MQNDELSICQWYNIDIKFIFLNPWQQFLFNDWFRSPSFADDTMGFKMTQVKTKHIHHNYCGMSEL